MKHQSGFTLIEVAVVLTIIGLFIGSLLVPLTTQIDNAKIQSTHDTLTEIKQALINYAASNNRLPCPALNPESGQAMVVGHVLCGQQGYLPWNNLGTGGYDAWGNSLLYRIDSPYTGTDGITKLVTTPASSLSVIIGKGTTNQTTINDVVAVVFSYGKNGQYAFNPFKMLNDLILPTALASVLPDDSDSSSPCEAGKICYLQKDYIPNGFDDNLVWLNRTTLVEKLVVAGKLPPPQTILSSIPSSTTDSPRIELPVSSSGSFCDSFKSADDCASSRECMMQCSSLFQPPQ